MPSYDKSPFAQPPEALIPGKPAYCFGSLNQDVSPTTGVITNVALASNVATVMALINGGPIPAVGSLITIAKSTSTAGLFNVTNLALTGVTITAATGVGTLTFALAHADVTSAADSGYFIIPTPEVGETFANGSSAAKGAQYSSQFQMEQTTQALAAVVNVTGAPTAGTITLQGAIINQDSEYATLGTIGATTNPTGGSLNFVGKYNFYRFNIASVAGGSVPKIVAKLVI